MKLQNGKIGGKIVIDERKYVVKPSRNGCIGCAFVSDKGAKHCEYARMCFAHCRIDQESVLFAAI